MEDAQTRAQTLRNCYRQFFRTADGRQFARSFGRSSPFAGQHSRPWDNGTDPDIDFCDPADIPAASIWWHPEDDLEPIHTSNGLDGLGYEQIAAACGVFEQALRFCIEGSDLVKKGARVLAVISVLRPDMGVRRLKPDQRLKTRFLEITQGANGAIELSGRLYGRVLEFLRGAERMSGAGERILLLAYQIRPDLISGNTLAQLGALTNTTRQAQNKVSMDLRDITGLKARAQRPEITRLRCRRGQFANRAATPSQKLPPTETSQPGSRAGNSNQCPPDAI